MVAIFSSNLNQRKMLKQLEDLSAILLADEGKELYLILVVKM